MEKILVSACLLGARVGYDGSHLYCDNTNLRRWIVEGRVVSVCPEVVAGLPVPRSASEIVGQGDGFGVLQGIARVKSKDGTDVTDSYVDGAKTTLKLVRRENIRLAIFKNKSPSCGSTRIYNGSFGNQIIEGYGVTAALLQQSGVEVYSEEEINQAKERLSILEEG
jgi:uncharacterized protein YbbK (DUF523 family)